MALPAEMQEDYEALGKVPWETRAEKIKGDFISVERLNWEVAFERDMDLFGRIMRDILKLEQAVPGRPGPRPSLDVDDATRRLYQLFGNDFTIRPFREAFAILANGRSLRHLARITSLSKDHCHKLMRGEVAPDGYSLRCIAAGFGKHPSYFLEYRQLYITYAVMRRLEYSPDTSIDLFITLDRQLKSRDN